MTSRTKHAPLRAGVLALLGFASSPTAFGAIAIDTIEDINNSGLGFGGAVNLFAFGETFSVDDAAVAMGNDVAVITMDGDAFSTGAGLSISISNGENGLNSSEGGANTDPPNLVPADLVFSSNASGRLENGNAIRFSAWMRQDPLDPVTKEPQLEPVLKIELWKEALSSYFDANPAPFPAFGDRIWDTDQNAGNAAFDGFNQSRASWVDMNNNGVTSFGNPVAQSLVTDQWRLVVATLVVDDDPLNDGVGWRIGSEPFSVAEVEEVRASVFVGDFQGSDLTDGGSMWIDNLMLEVFANEAEMLATAVPNPRPIPEPTALLLAAMVLPMVAIRRVPAHRQSAPSSFL